MYPCNIYYQDIIENKHFTGNIADWNLYDGVELTKDGKYNYQAFILSDQNDLSYKIAQWEGPTKQSKYIFKKDICPRAKTECMKVLLIF